MTRTQKVLSFFAAIVVVALFLCTPLLALQSMKKAIDQGDAERVSAFIDYPQLKDNLKQGLERKLLATKSDNSIVGNVQGMLGGLALSLSDRFIDVLVSPEGMAALLKAKRPGDNDSTTNREGEEDPDITMFYEQLNIFVVAITKKQESAKPIELVFRRSGLFGWKLSDIRFLS